MSIARRGTPTTGDPGNTTNWVVTLPTGVVSGDAILVGISRDNNNTPVVTPPTGFVLLGTNGNDDNQRVYVYRKISDGTEGASVTFSLTAAEPGTWGCLAYSGVDNGTPEDVATSTFTTSGSTSTPTQTSQTTVTDHAFVVGFYGKRGVAGLSGTPGSSATERIDHQDVGDTVFFYVEELDKTPAGAIALAFTASSSTNLWQGVQVALRPSAAAAATHIGPFAGKLAMVADIVDEWTGGGRQSIASGIAPSIAPSIGGR